MALQGSGTISLQDIENEFGGSGSISLSEYYRGGSYVPCSRTIDNSYWQYQPSSGWYADEYVYSVSNSDNGWAWMWNSSQVSSTSASSVTTGGWTYYKGSLFSSDSKLNMSHYRIRRQRYVASSYQQNINAGIPSSGRIDMSDFYGGTNS